MVVQITGTVSEAENWASFPILKGKNPLTGIKEGVEILLFADEGREEVATGFQELQDSLKVSAP